QFTVYGAPAMPSVTIAVAALQGKLAKQADVSLKIWRSPDQLRAGVASGQFKVMMSPSNVGVNLRNQGQKVGMVNILTNGITQLMCKGSAIASPQDLIGKKILVPFKNDMPDIVLQALLKKLKIDAHKVGITYTATPPEAVGLFLSKEYHACPHAFTKSKPRTTFTPIVLPLSRLAVAIGSGRMAADRESVVEGKRVD
ncbi:ABC transporter substrate-binding protein, partial [Escherichia coli]|uniref:ABC transporter substrate-binding protein n=1 Tax=Escherichia coli TaxID=562 RepID=UPI001CA4F022